MNLKIPTLYRQTSLACLLGHWQSNMLHNHQGSSASDKITRYPSTRQHQLLGWRVDMYEGDTVTWEGVRGHEANCWLQCLITFSLCDSFLQTVTNKDHQLLRSQQRLCNLEWLNVGWVSCYAVLQQSMGCTAAKNTKNIHKGGESREDIDDWF